MNRQNDWREFERLVAVIEQALHKHPGVTVTHNVQLPSKYGVKRQVDVLIKYDTELVKKTIAIECKKLKSKVGINVIEAFNGMMKAVNADEGIIVSANGFQSGALKAAGHYGIKLYRLSQAQDIQRYLQSFRVYPYKLRHQSSEIYGRFNSDTPINKLVGIKSELWIEEAKRVTTIAELLKIYLQGCHTDISRGMFASLFNPNEARRLTVTNEIVLQFSFPMIFRFEGMETEVIGFRAVIQTSLSTSSAELEQASIYEDVVDADSQNLILELRIDQGELDWLQKD